MTRVMMVQLQNGEPYPFTLRWKAFLDEWKPADPVTVSIDFEGLSQRIFSTPVEPGTYKSLKAGSLQVWYLSKESFGFPGIEEFFHPKSVRDYTLKSYDMKEKDGKDVLDGIGFFELSADRSNIAYMAGKTTGIVDAATGGKVGDGKVQWYGTDYTVNTSAEYAQIFRDVWRQIRDFFYDPNIHGKNWPGIYAKYAELVPFVATREDINYLIGEMIGELTASHEYIIGDGGPQRTSFDRVRAGLLGASIELDKEARLYRITRVLQGRSDRDEYRSPLQAPDIGNVEGFYILRIDGEDVLPNRNFWSYLEGKSGKEITMTVNKKPEIKDARTITLETLRSEYALRYWDSIQRNIERVRKATDDRIGYMHLSDMDEEGLSQFEEAFRALRYKDGLIIDVRYNGGGFVSWFMIDKLERLVHFLAQTRDFAPMYYPHGTRRGPIVVLCNEGTGSDGEVFTEHFKEAGLGTVVGTRTWGGLIGIINMVPLLDGGMVTQSNVGFANLRGSWVVENHGAEPDIAVEMSPEAILKDEDPQLDYAISLIQKQVKENPPVKLVPPPFPVK